jgi:thiosulfate/3-mercaptopyruvate sulfurtransferase
MTSRNFCTTAELAAELKDPDLGVIDASWHLPNTARIGAAEFRAKHIPGAVFFDIDAIADHSTELPHMLPGPKHFGEAAGALGIADSDTIVVYDSLGLYSAARVWWTFRIFGAKNVYILDGGLPKWKAENRPLETGDGKRPPRSFNAQMNVGAVATLGDVRMAVTDDSVQVVDARSAARFKGQAPEPRPGLRSGHMPGAFNVPFDQLIENGTLVSRERIAQTFTDAGVDLKKPIITSCGSGMTAAILTFALESIGTTATGLYDGSWTEWGSRPDTPVERE